MNLKSITTREQLEGAKALGILSEKDILAVETRLAKAVEKPTAVIPENFSEVTVEYMPPRGNRGSRHFSACVKEGRNGKFISLLFPVNVVGNCGYGDVAFLDHFIEKALDMRDSLNKAGIKTDRKPTA